MTTEQENQLNLALEKIEEANSIIGEILQGEVDDDEEMVLEPISDSLADSKQELYKLLDL